ncbi:MAG: 3-phosphoshikimate 1-carboxyvinyltransferase [Marinilabiliaceae bacterium]|jgi:3-phosphoshikimate 1-carboxyvinyltransferase|nr:3-phosphoshikimate 1-carboxyvinyltransferase [Marinilabiliaceae bacterium]
MKVIIKPSSIGGSVNAPSSKSSMQRAVAAALLARGKSVLLNPSLANDSLAAMNMAECLGAVVRRMPGRVEIDGGLKPGCRTLDGGESGLAVRMFSAIASLCSDTIEISGSGTIMGRPMDMVVNTLRMLGAEVNSTGGKLPVTLKGPVRGGRAEVDGSVSSQFLTGLLVALPLVEDDTELIVSSLKSKPYIDLTIEVLRNFGVEIVNQDYRKFYIRGGQKYTPCTYMVEEDWSGIAFLAVAGALGRGISIEGVSATSLQADRVITDILERAGAGVTFTNNSLKVAASVLHSFEADITDCPDLAPPLVALASFCRGRSLIKGTSRLRAKESNRAETLCNEFSKLGVMIDSAADSLTVTGTDTIKSAACTSHGDHRIAMAVAVAALHAEGEVEIANADAINKSYPEFFNNLGALGADIEINN